MEQGISISAVKFDNEPFFRSLTATIMSLEGTNLVPATGSEIISWSNFNLPNIDNGVYATNLSGETYNFGTTAQVSAFGTLIFRFSATTYDYYTTDYTLLSFSIGATYLSGDPLSAALLTSIDIPYDTFPAINLSAYLNFQVTESNDFFYRLVSTNPYTANFSVSSTTYNLASNLSANYYKTYYIINNDGSTIYNSLSTFNFERSSTCLSSVKVTLSALSASGSLSAWYTPHTLERSLTAVFVNNYISAAPFIAYPGEYFDTPYTRATITPANLSTSPGLEFYGEGHTENIYLSTQPSNEVTKYVWKFGDNSGIYTPLVSGTTEQLSSAVVSISTAVGVYPKIPIQLQATNSTFPSSSPLYYYDDNTGIKTFYPYIVSTIDPYGNELSTSKYFSSIVVKPYDEFTYVFTPGAPSVVYLPSNGNPTSYLASLFVQITAGIDSTDPCFGIYGYNWKWSTFENCSATNTFVNKPSSWATTQCLVSAGTTGPLSTTSADPGAFAKKWGYQPPTNISVSITNPIFYTPGSTTWNLYTNKWTKTPQINTSAINPSQYPYSLRVSNYGSTPLTVSQYESTLVTLNVQKPVTSQINVSSYGKASDWQPKTTDLNLTHEILSIPAADIKFYTSNRFVLTGVPVKFENISTGTATFCSIIINFNDETTGIVLSAPNTNQSFYVTFSSTGQKSLTITGITSNSVTPLTLSLPNIVEVVQQYDQVDITAYRSTDTPLELPYSNEIKIAANDWAVADVYNSCIEKFYKNLEYLNNRGKVYNGDYSDYFGWLGPLPVVPEASSCPFYTWNDVNCTITPEIEVTWTDALSTDSYVGDFASCGTWSQQTCGRRKTDPSCLQLYCITWTWKERKCKNTDKPITWKQAKCSGEFKKKWYFEPCVIVEPIICDEGFWNVNIPKLNTYYDPLGNCQVQKPCIYYGVTSKDNILYVAQKTQIKVLSSDYQATLYSSLLLFDDSTAFNNIKNICLDSQGKIFVLDGDLLQVGSYTLNNNVWEQFITWGGVGTATSRSKFYNPNDIHIDQNDNVWVTDTGNNCVKGFSNTGSWLTTITNDEFKNDVPLSTCVDSQNNLHVLTEKQISVYDIKGSYIFSYDYKSYITGNAIRINTSYNREVIYLCTDSQVIKFFKNGKFNSYIIKSKDCVNNITAIYQDEFRNLLITSNDKILKYPDLMTVVPIKGDLPDYYWSLEDLYIHPEEYVQNWVYNKSLQRLWDCIEIFRSTVMFDNTKGICKCYRAPVYQKQDIIVGQNEIVTSTVINRSLGYLWQNFVTLLDYFDPNCINRYNNYNAQQCSLIDIGAPVPYETEVPVIVPPPVVIPSCCESISTNIQDYLPSKTDQKFGTGAVYSYEDNSDEPVGSWYRTLACSRLICVCTDGANNIISSTQYGSTTNNLNLLDVIKNNNLLNSTTLGHTSFVFAFTFFGWKKRNNKVNTFKPSDTKYYVWQTILS